MKIFGLLDPDVIWALPFITAALWAIGGSGIKPVRRVGVLLAILIFALGFGVDMWRILLETVTLFLVFSFGYGDAHKKSLNDLYYPYLFLLGLSDTGSQVFFVTTKNIFAFGIGAFITGLAFPALTFASQKYKFPIWKWVELIRGFLIGLVSATLISLK